MTVTTRARRLLPAALVVLVLLPARAADNLDQGFMPRGGRALLIQVLGAPGDATELRAAVAARRSEPEWRAFVDARARALGERERATLAAYLAVNLPLSADAAARADLAAALPPDGRDLAWNECQSCHSLFAGYLTQDREAQAWRNIFLSPFHRQMKMTPQEREEFARYSAINMPMRAEDVPRDLRF